MFIHKSIITGKEILGIGLSNSIGIGAFNFSNMEILQAIVESANEENTPCIIQVTESAIKYMGMKYVVNMVSAAAEDSNISLCLHLDHGSSFEACKMCIDAGFSSVMIDKSSLSFEENVSTAKEVVEYARKYDVSVEAELGTLAGIEDDISNNSSLLTDPEMAYLFVNQTGVDSLAVAIGTSHGPNKGKNPRLDIDRLLKIKEKIGNDKFPLVLHGASSIYPDIIEKCNSLGACLKNTSGINDDDIKKAICAGIAKINVDSDIRISFLNGVLEAMQDNPSNIDLRKYLSSAKDAAKSVIKRKMRSFIVYTNRE